MTARPLTVIGLGPMGQAMVRTFMAAGRPVTVWNRTVARADALVDEGALLAATPGEAVAAADVVVLSLTDYQAMYDILGRVAPAELAGTVLVNLSSDSPDESRRAAAWAAERGAEFLTGGVMNPAPMVGTEGALVYYSGRSDVFARVEDVVRVLGAPRYLGTDPGLAQLYYQAQLDVFLTTLAALLHAVALTAAAGVSAAEFLPEAMRTIVDIPAMVEDVGDLARHLDTSEHAGDLSTTEMMGATARHIVATSEALGVDVALPLAVQSLYDRAIAAGRGAENWTSLLEVMRPARSSTTALS